MKSQRRLGRKNAPAADTRDCPRALRCRGACVRPPRYVRSAALPHCPYRDPVTRRCPLCAVPSSVVPILFAIFKPKPLPAGPADWEYRVLPGTFHSHQLIHRIAWPHACRGAMTAVWYVSWCAWQTWEDCGSCTDHECGWCIGPNGGLCLPQTRFSECGPIRSLLTAHDQCNIDEGL